MFFDMSSPGQRVRCPLVTGYFVTVHDCLGANMINLVVFQVTFHINVLLKNII